MKLLRQFVTIACMLIGAIAHAAGDYEQHIRKLAAGTPPEEIKASLQALADAAVPRFQP